MAQDAKCDPMAPLPPVCCTKERKTMPRLNKEALTFIYVVKKSHQHLYVKKIYVLLTDHQPLTIRFSPKKGIPPLAAEHAYKDAPIPISAYNYDICYKPAREHCNVYGLSRLRLPSKEILQTEEGVSVFKTGQFQALPVTF